MVVEHLSPEQIRAYVIADNRLAERAGWDEGLPTFDQDDSPATRVAGATALNAIAARVPELVGGAAA